MTLTKLIRTSVAALGALAVASQANAADIYANGLKEPPVYIPAPTWTGFYVGVHMGAAWASLDVRRFKFDDHFKDEWEASQEWGYVPNSYYPAWLGGRDLESTNVFGGAQFGYNFQSSCCFVYGIEVDLGGMSLNGHRVFRDHTGYLTEYEGATYDNPHTLAFLDAKHDGGFYGDITGRLGYTWNNVLLYAKGGFAFLNADLRLRERFYDTKHDFDITDAVIGGWYDFFRNDGNGWSTGWTIGGGLEWKVAQNWSLKAEYLHFNFGTDDHSCCNDWYSQASGWNKWHQDGDLTVDTVKIGFNYFFVPVAAPVVPLK